MEEPASWITFLVTCLIILYGNNLFKKELPKFLAKAFDYLGEISYPIYLFHWPIFLYLDYLGFRNSWYFLLGSILFTIPANYLFDKVLKKLLWIPAANYVEEKFQSYKVISR